MLLVDLWEIWGLGGGVTKKQTKKSSENDQLTGHFQSFFCLFFISPEKKQ